MLSLFKNWNKSKDDPNSRCSSTPMNAEQLLGGDIKEKKGEECMTDEQGKIEPQEQDVTPMENVSDGESDSLLSDDTLTLSDKIELALHTVYDPEIPVNIMELGLVYSIDIKENNVVFVVMTLTAPACPVAGDIVLEVENKIKNITGVTDAHIQLTFDPPWSKEMMSEEAKLELGFL